MTPILALYLPKPEELTLRLEMLFVAWLVLVFCAKLVLKIGTILPASLMAFGFVIAVSPGVYAAYFWKPLTYSYAAKTYPGYSDNFFEVVAFFHVGWGSVLGLTGMIAGLAITSVVDMVIRRKTQLSHTPTQSVT